MEYSLWSREPEDEILATVRKLGIGLVAYSPRGRGFLTGHIRPSDDLATDDYRHDSPRFQGGNFERDLDLLRVIENIARDRGCTPASAMRARRPRR